MKFTDSSSQWDRDRERESGEIGRVAWLLILSLVLLIVIVKLGGLR